MFEELRINIFLIFNHHVNMFRIIVTIYIYILINTNQVLKNL
jgi:hypothetical protein